MLVVSSGTWILSGTAVLLQSYLPTIDGRDGQTIRGAECVDPAVMTIYVVMMHRGGRSHKIQAR